MNILKYLCHKIKLFFMDGVIQSAPLNIYVAMHGEDWRLYFSE